MLLFFAVVLFSCSDSSDSSETTGTLAGLTTAVPSETTLNSVFCGGTITNTGGTPITKRGVCWSTSINPTIDLITKTEDGSGNGSFVSSITGLQQDTRYFVRAYATNSKGTSYGNQVYFNSLTTTPNVTDADGNVYETIKIGTQVWMKENLKTTKFCNGEAIQNITGNEWYSLTTPAWCYYNNDEANNQLYGKLYNWYAVADPRNIAPCGWHVATQSDWTVLENYLGSAAVAGGKLKSTSVWFGPNTTASNQSGFSAYPGGIRAYSNTILYYGWNGVWWAYNPNGGWGRVMHCQYASVSSVVLDEEMGVSVRCVKD